MGERIQAALDCPAVQETAHTLARSAPNLPLFNALQPSRVLLIADGAPWIWKRFTALIEQGAIACPHPVIQLIDFYHAVEHLGAFAEAMLMIRSYYKAQRWNELAQLACAAPIEALQ